MAHTCEECGEVCYCGGDVDDIVLDDEDLPCEHPCAAADQDPYDDCSGCR